MGPGDDCSHHIYSQEPREMNAHAHLLDCCAQLDFATLIQSRDPCLENGATHTGLCLLTSVNFVMVVVSHGYDHRSTHSSQVI